MAGEKTTDPRLPGSRLRLRLAALAEPLRAPAEFAFCHLSGRRNIGDRCSGPYAYFDFPNARVTPQPARIRPPRVLVYGGGFIADRIVDHVARDVARPRHRVAWGVGLAASPSLPRFRETFGKFALAGIREWEPECPFDYVPCVSCMAPFFDSVPPPETEVVLYTHRNKSAELRRVPGIPERDNFTGSLAAALRFIARGETVVTNSYHGTYWALLMGRRVLCVPFNTKFDRFRQPPGVAGPEDWPERLGAARRADGFLEESRTLNRAFYERVRAL